MGVELLAKDKKGVIEFQGKCKLIINSVSKLLLVEPFIEEFKMISAIFKWKFVAQKNILFVFAEYDIQDFALIFDNTNIGNKTNEFLIQKGAIIGDMKMIVQRFLPILFTEISKNNESSLKMKEILFKWIEFFDGKEKEEYIQILKDYNIYDLIYPKNDGNINRKRKFHQLSYKAESNVADNKDGEKLPKKKSAGSRVKGKRIFKPNFEVLTFQQRNATRKRLFLFSSNDRTKCYEYYWDKSELCFQCCGCTTRGKAIRAYVCKNSNGIQFVKHSKSIHICEMREYNPEKYTFDPTKNIVQKSNFKVFQYVQNGIQKTVLIIFCSTNKNLCYEYFWHKHRKLYYCYQCCRTVAVTAIIERTKMAKNMSNCVKSHIFVI